MVIARRRRPRERDLSACASSSVRSSFFFFRSGRFATGGDDSAAAAPAGARLFDPRPPPALEDPAPSRRASGGVPLRVACEREARPTRGQLAEGRVDRDPLPLHLHLGPGVPGEGRPVPGHADRGPPGNSRARCRFQPVQGLLPAALPVGRVGVAEDIARQILAFMEIGFATGSVVFIDGGGSIA